MFATAFILLFGIVAGGLFAFAFAGAIREHIHEAHKHGNKLLPALHASWIVTVVVFALHGFVLF